jgi:high affinity sulfate transporter 1
VLSNYNGTMFLQDLGAGLVLATLLAPVGMGYAEASGLPAIYGLYATIIPLMAYAIFGPSRILILGPDSALSALIAATILPLAGSDPQHAAALAGMLAVLVGIISILAGLFKFGFITDLLSKPIRHGYMNGIALTLLFSQLPKMLGFAADGSSLFSAAKGLLLGILTGNVNSSTCGIGVVCLIIILVTKHWFPRLPGVLFAVIWATIVVALFNLASTAQVAVVGTLPQGLPGLQVVSLSMNEFLALCSGATAIALVSIADMSVLSRIYAARGNYYVDANQELVALGIANVTTGLLQGFPVSSSSSRTPVAESAGAKSQMTGLVGAACIVLLLLFAPRLLYYLPIAALGAIVISVCSSIIEVREVRRLYQLRRGEFVLSMICFLGVAVLGVVQGIFISVGLALVGFIWRAWRPYSAILGRIDGFKGYHDTMRHPEARRIPGLVLFRWDAPLFFANAEIFREQVLQAAAEAPTPTKWLVVAAEPVTDIDITAADILSELDHELQKSGITLCFAQMKGPVKDRLKQYGMFCKLGQEHFFPTIGQAVDHYVQQYDVAWIDWEDRKK